MTFVTTDTILLARTSATDLAIADRIEIDTHLLIAIYSTSLYGEVRRGIGINAVAGVVSDVVVIDNIDVV